MTISGVYHNPHRKKIIDQRNKKFVCNTLTAVELEMVSPSAKTVKAKKSLSSRSRGDRMIISP